MLSARREAGFWRLYAADGNLAKNAKGSPAFTVADLQNPDAEHQNALKRNRPVGGRSGFPLARSTMPAVAGGWKG